MIMMQYFFEVFYAIENWTSFQYYQVNYFWRWLHHIDFIAMNTANNVFTMLCMIYNYRMLYTYHTSSNEVYNILILYLQPIQ